MMITVQRYLLRLAIIFSLAVACAAVPIIYYKAKTSTVTVNRQLLGLPVRKLAASNLKLDRARSIAGFAQATLFITTDSPGVMLAMDKNIVKDTTFRIPIPYDPAIASSFETFVDSPNVTILAGNNHLMIKGSLKISHIMYTRLPLNNFTRAIPVGNGFVVRQYELVNANWAQVFCKYDTITGRIRRESQLSPGTQDAGFATDGLLHLNKRYQLLVYCYFNRSEILCFDTALQQKRVIPTIEPSNFSSHTSNFDERGLTVITNQASSEDIHYLSCTADSFIYVQSLVKSTVPPSGRNSKNIIMDRYNILDGKYAGSFYLPLKTGSILQDIKVIRDTVYVLYNDYIILYAL